MSTTRTLRARTYDTLELASLAFGGIGAGIGGKTGIPYCVYGFTGIDPKPTHKNPMYNDVADVVTVNENDMAVMAVNSRKGKSDKNARITFAEWCRELGIVRGK